MPLLFATSFLNLLIYECTVIPFENALVKENAPPQKTPQGMHKNFENASGYFLFFYFFRAPLPLSSPRGVIFSAIVLAAPRGVIQGIHSGNIVVVAAAVVFAAVVFICSN